MDRMKAIEQVKEGLALLQEGARYASDACQHLQQALDLLDHPREALTDRERHVLEVITGWEGQRPPSFQELAEACGLSSRSYARDLVISLEDKRYVQRATGRARAFKVLRPASPTAEKQP